MGVCICVALYSSPYLCVLMNCSLFFFCICSTSSWDLAKLQPWHHYLLVDTPTLIGRERIKKLAVCCSIQGLFIMYLLPLFKSLMQEVRSHMTEREERGSIYVCCVEEWRCLYCYVQTKVSTATTCTISPLIKTQGWSASITPHSHARTHICAHTRS